MVSERGVVSEAVPVDEAVAVAVGQWYRGVGAMGADLVGRALLLELAVLVSCAVEEGELRDVREDEPVAVRVAVTVAVAVKV